MFVVISTLVILFGLAIHNAVVRLSRPASDGGSPRAGRPPLHLQPRWLRASLSDLAR
jgi:hypothetical protein